MAGHADLAACIEDVVQASSPWPRKREIAVEVAEEPLLVRGDVEGLRRMVGNLVDNAVKYTPAGGWVRVRALRSADDVIVEVEDNGIGIPEGARERVFERFCAWSKKSRAARLAGLTW